MIDAHALEWLHSSFVGCALAAALSDHRNFALRIASLVLQSEQLMQRLLDSPIRRRQVRVQRLHVCMLERSI